MAGENHTDHFTPADRREIIETGVNLKNLREDFADLKKAIDNRQAKDDADDERIDERIRALENFRWWILGASAALSMLSSIIGSHLFK
jgi:hypothetical protein